MRLLICYHAPCRFLPIQDLYRTRPRYLPAILPGRVGRPGFSALAGRHASCAPDSVNGAMRARRIPAVALPATATLSSTVTADVVKGVGLSVNSPSTIVGLAFISTDS